MYPRMLITLDENLESKAVTVRVGQVSRFLSLRLFRAGALTIVFRGGRRRWPGGQASDDLGLPDAHDAGARRDDGTGRAGDGGVHPVRARARGLRYFAEKSGVGERGSDGAVDAFFSLSDSLSACVLHMLSGRSIHGIINFFQLLYQHGSPNGLWASHSSRLA
jgi:hypothetical protein